MKKLLFLSFLTFSTNALAVVSGTFPVVSTTATDRIQGPTVTVKGCVLQANPSNPDFVSVGDNTVTSTMGSVQGVKLAPGEKMVTFYLGNLNNLYFVSEVTIPPSSIEYLCDK